MPARSTNPNWFAIDADNAKHIFLDVARHDTILPAGVNVFRQHATLNDGTPLEPMVLATVRRTSSVDAADGRRTALECGAAGCAT